METYYFQQSFVIDEMEIQPVYIRIEELRPLIASHRHSHSSYEIHYTAKGRGKVIVEGISYPVQEHTLYVTGPDISHEQYADPANPVLEYCLYINCRPLKKRKVSSFAKIFLDTPFWYGKDEEQVFEVMKDLIGEMREHRFGREEMAEVLLRRIIIALSRGYQKEPQANQAKERGSTFFTAEHYPLVEDAFFYHYRTLQLADLASLLNLSQRQTQRFLQEHYGKSFSQKLVEARMSAALQMLVNTDYSMEKIAEEIGYSSGEHFSTAFKRIYQQTPSRYRRNHVRQ